MKGFLSYDNPAVSVLLKICNMVVLSAVWAVCCIPIFTAGAATTALYYSVQKWLKHERGYACGCFWESFKANFKQTTLGSLILLALGVLIFSDFWIVRFFQREGITAGAMKPLFLVLLGILCVYGFWFFASVARFGNTLKGHLKNSAALLICHWPVSLAIFAIEAVCGILYYLAPYFILILPVISVWLMGLFTERVFRRYMSEEDRDLEDERNMIYGEKRGKVL